MGAPLLRLLVLALLAACGAPAQPEPPDGRRAGNAADDPHAAIACAGCHRGGRADVGRASVPPTSCTAAGCHEDGGAERVRLATATFEHRRHGADGEIQPSCAGCHTHPAGGEPLRASVDACALCHLPQLTSRASADCQVCHVQTQHVTLTSAGVPVPHASLPWAEIGCVRCHYDVADPPLEVATERCAACHRDVAAVTRRGIGSDLHPPHAGVTCTACHAAGAHQVRALSSAVALVCADCHGAAHALRLGNGTPAAQAALAAGAAAWADSRTCAECHTGVHAAQQRLLLGLLPGGQATPSEKFLLGMTCRSCHVPPPEGLGDDALRGQARACVACHGPDYRPVLDWWLRGLQQRLHAASAYVAAGRRELGGGASDSAQALLASAAEMLALVREAGGQHNLELADRIFRESVLRVEAAYRADGRRAPATPALGRPPHTGLCTGCHYADGPWDLRQMPGPLHDRFLRRTGE